MIQTDIFLDDTIPPRPRQAYFTNWDEFRYIRANDPSQEASTDNFQDRVDSIISDARLVSTRLRPEIPSEVVDSRLQKRTTSLAQQQAQPETPPEAS